MKVDCLSLNVSFLSSLYVHWRACRSFDDAPAAQPSPSNSVPAVGAAMVPLGGAAAAFMSTPVLVGAPRDDQSAGSVTHACTDTEEKTR